MRQQSNSKFLLTENLQIFNESTTKLARTCSAWGTCYDGFLFYESKMDKN